MKFDPTKKCSRMKMTRLKYSVLLQIFMFVMILSLIVIGTATASNNATLRVGGVVIFAIALPCAFLLSRKLSGFSGPETAAQKKLPVVVEITYTILVVGALLIAALKVQTAAGWRLFFLIGLPFLIVPIWRRYRDRKLDHFGDRK